MWPKQLTSSTKPGSSTSPLCRSAPENKKKASTKSGKTSIACKNTRTTAGSPVAPTNPRQRLAASYLPFFSNSHSPINNIDTFFFICVFTYQMISLNYVQIIESSPERLLFDESFRIDFHFCFLLSQVLPSNQFQ